MNAQMLNLPNRLHLSRSAPCAARTRLTGCCISRASQPQRQTCPHASHSRSVPAQAQEDEHEHPPISAVALEQASCTSTSSNTSSIQSRCGFLATGILSWVLQSQYSALADDETALAEVTNVLVALDGGDQKINDFLISIVFTLVIAALSIVTLGVAYLSFATWNDNRLQSEDEDAAKRSLKFPAAAASSKKQSDDELVSFRKSSKIKKDKNKGFGGNPFSD